MTRTDNAVDGFVECQGLTVTAVVSTVHDQLVPGHVAVQTWLRAMPRSGRPGCPGTNRILPSLRWTGSIRNAATVTGCSSAISWTVVAA